MNPLEDLRRRLDSAAPAEWEGEFSRLPVDVTRNEAYDIVSSGRPYSDWFGFRFDAGPPGISLPLFDDSFEAVLTGHGAGPLHAYRLIFAAPRPLPENVETGFIVAVLRNSTSAALRAGVTWFASWLAARAGLAGLALGQPEVAWMFLDVLTIKGKRHPHLDKLALFEPIRGNSDLERSPWVRAAICRLWPGMGVPLVPRLPFPEIEEAADVQLEDIVQQLDACGAIKVRELVESFADAMSSAAVEEHAEDPLVRELRERAMSLKPEPPDVGDLPEWFEKWAQALGRPQEWPTARLAALLIHRLRPSGRPLAAVLIMRKARTADLRVVRDGFAEAVITDMIDELTAAAGNLPAEVADALIAEIIPRHVDHGRGLAVLARNLDLLRSLSVKPGGMVEHLITFLGTAASDRAAEHAAIRTTFDSFVVSVGQHAAKLADAVSPDPTEFERRAASLQMQTPSSALLELASETEWPVPLERLCMALSIRRALAGTDRAPFWRTAFSKFASDALYDMKRVELFELRLRLLDEIIADPHPSHSMAELHFHRANTRNALKWNDTNSVSLTLGDLHQAARYARKEGNSARAASAISALAKTIAGMCLQGDVDALGERAAVEKAIEEILRLPLTSFDRAHTLQARAHLKRATSAASALPDFEEALALLPTQDPFWSEVAAELVVTLVRAGQVGAATERGRDFLRRTSCATGDTELGMLQCAVGEALARGGQPQEARQQLETGLGILRGRDTLNEAVTRINLAWLGLAQGDWSMVGEHLRAMKDRDASLGPAQRRDVAVLEVELAKRLQHPDEVRDALLRQLAVAQETADRLHALLQLARLDARAGQAPQGIDHLLRESIAEPDPRLEPLIEDLACNHRISIESGTRDALCAWAAERGRRSVVARLHQQEGKTEEAKTLLRQALADTLPATERIGCAHLLITLLLPEDRDERRRLCSEIEDLIAAGYDHPVLRRDLAAAIHMDAADDLVQLRRALRHAEAGDHGGNPARAAERSQAIQGRIRVDMLRLSLVAPQSETAELASWFLETRAVPPLEVKALRQGAASLLLRIGPLASPSAVQMASQLLALAETEESEAVAARLSWIEASQAGCVAKPPVSAQPGPFDAAPAWLVAVFAGRPFKVSPEELTSGTGMLSAAVRMRSDGADHVLASLLPEHHKLSRGAQRELLRVMYEAVQLVVVTDSERQPWPLLRRALASVQKKHSHALLASIESGIRRAKGPRVEGVRNEAPVIDPEPVMAKTPTYAGGRERLQECFNRGVELINVVHDSPYAPDGAALINEARALLGEAVRIAKKKKLGYFDVLVSWGNSWRTPPGEDVEKALRIYGEAAQLKPNRDQRAKLWKVRADALLRRGRGEDIREADRLLARSAEIREGWLLVETLTSAAAAALEHPDLDEWTRERRAAEHLMAAVHADRGYAEKNLETLLARLVAWERLQPNDERPARYRDELRVIYSHRAGDIDRRRPRFSEKEIDAVVGVLRHAAGRAFVEIRMRFRSRKELESDSSGLAERLDPKVREQILEDVDRDSLQDRPEETEAFLRQLQEPSEPEARAGFLVGKAFVLAQLARHRRRAAAEVRDATEEARGALRGLDHKAVRANLTRELAAVWSPDDHADDPVRDFGLAVELLRECVALEGGEVEALDDTLRFLARSLRFSPSGDINANRREARRLYQDRLAHARLVATPGLVAGMLANLADVESESGEGNRAERSKRSEELLVEAVNLAESAQKKAQYLGNLAWERTQIGCGLLQEGDDEGLEYLKKALATFDQVDLSVAEEHGRRKVLHNRAVCETTLARFTKGRAVEVAEWRSRLHSADLLREPVSFAMIQHNLANALMVGTDVTAEQLAEGLTLSGHAIKIRTLEQSPRHHWETSLNAGRAILVAMRMGHADALGWSFEKALGQIALWLGRALKAARVLGSGSELADTAFAMGEAACLSPTTSQTIVEAETAWQAIGEAAPYLLLDATYREREAAFAMNMAVTLSYRIAEDGVVLASPGIEFALQGERAEPVRRWLLRSQLAFRRPSRARLSRPEEVSAALWSDWSKALRERDHGAVTDVLRRIHEVAPQFLTESDDAKATEAWLAARPRSLAVSIVPLLPVSLAFVSFVAANGVQRWWVLGLEAPPPPLDPTLLPKLLRDALRGRDARAAHGQVADWAREHFTGPIARFIEFEPSLVLWVPNFFLRHISPGAIWPGVPIATSASLAPQGRTGQPSRRRSTLVALADPGTGDRLDLGSHGLQSLKRLADAAARRGPVRRMASVGRGFGRALLGADNTVRDTPVSASDVLEEAAEHDVLVLIAHGEVDDLETATIVCLGRSGEKDRLDVDLLSRHPERLAGATVVLLSCESGRVGASLAEPGGLAGTLISAGARCVVAPLWPIRLDVATHVAEALLNGFAASDDPWDVLARLQVLEMGKGPMMGAPPPSLAERGASEELQRLAFVTWVG